MDPSAIGTYEQIANHIKSISTDLQRKDGEKKIFVPADAPIVTYVPGDKADLKPGTKVFILRALAFAAIASAIQLRRCSLRFVRNSQWLLI